MPAAKTVSVSQARANFTQIGRLVNETREPVTVFKGSTPYLVISPAPVVEVLNAESQKAFDDLKTMREDPDIEPYKSEGELFAALGL